ncbi:major facilitator superfamily domain-containing protein [Pyronema omphalodes]|nr:major facilitator superfamily domain-containing protein [Pyronema omphalodes]
MRGPTLLNSKSLGIHVVEVDEGAAALRSSWEGDPDYEFEETGEGNGAAEFEEKVSRKQLWLIYSLQLAEAIVAASLSPQLYVLLRDSELCGSINTAYWTGLVEAIFALGSITGLCWGRLGDKYGRKPIALIGMIGLSVSCIVMGFSTGIFMCALIRAFAGLMSSCIRVAVAAMLGDISHSSRAKARSFSRLPLVATGGVIGPLLQAALAHRFANDGIFWKTYPILISQMACAALMLAIFGVNLAMLKETLPSSLSAHDFEKSLSSHRRGSESSDEFGEESSFLGRNGIALPHNDKLAPIALSEILRSRSLMIILAAYSLFSLHSASFDQLLPLLGNSPTKLGGLGLPCSFISLVVFFASLAAGLVIWFSSPRAIKKLGLLPSFRAACWVLPAIYFLTPLLSKLAHENQPAIIATSVFSIFSKTLVTGAIKTLVLIVVTNSSPDPYSLATIMGAMELAGHVRALAVLGTGAAWWLAEDLGRGWTNYGLWATILGVSILGGAAAHLVRDRPYVRDYEGSLRWEVCYDSMTESTEDLQAFNEKEIEASS